MAASGANLTWHASLHETHPKALQRCRSSHAATNVSRAGA